MVYESGKIKISPEVDLNNVSKVKFATLGKVLSGPESVRLRTTSDDLSVPDTLKETLSGSQKNMKQGGLWRCETEPSRPDEC
ncbi:hypothetical protein GCM10017783_22960 [Deinococcus piscis]|uniref:Uncharacterized protein n=1 Tax=Deinococcus piscis TaxID=394230 RepID=A0ABQ3K9U8_9DEIO|nr:hypothetical protein GCM10017783_22960 [Deinococcus piscis]